jgi:hypothetical protein
MSTNDTTWPCQGIPFFMQDVGSRPVDQKSDLTSIGKFLPWLVILLPFSHYMIFVIKVTEVGIVPQSTAFGPQFTLCAQSWRSLPDASVALAE